MSDTSLQSGRESRGQRNWDGVAAIVAALIGFLALLVSGYTAYIQRQQVRAQVWPYLLIGYADFDRSIIDPNRLALLSIETPVKFHSFTEASHLRLSFRTQ